MKQQEKDRLDLRQEFERLFSNKRYAQIALDAMPPIDYDQLVTRTDLESSVTVLDAKIERLDAKIDKVDAKIEKVDAKMERQMAALTRSMYFGFLSLFGALSAVISVST